LTIFEERIDLLGPLHKCLNSHLSKFDWLLKGPPTPEKIETAVRGHSKFTSVDLVSATDNLPLDVAEAILSTLLARCTKVPGGIRLLAVNSLRPLVRGPWGTYEEVTHGQMMGGYLSFPLLCLQSYLAARWASKGHAANFLVNGDDTLIASDTFVDQEKYPRGFVLNLEKTIHSENTVEINSTVFLGTKGKWRQVHHLRRGGATADYAGMLHLAAACRDRNEWTDAFLRARIGRRWGFLPSQLGLHPESYVAYSVGYAMRRYHTDLPDLSGDVPDIGLEYRRGVPAEDEIGALSGLLWEKGRPVAEKRAEPPSQGKLRRSYQYISSKVRRNKNYLFHIASSRVLARKDREGVYAVPADYTPYEEQRRVREIDLFTIADDEV